MSFYEKLYQAESCKESAADEFLCELPQLSEQDKMDLESPLNFSEISKAVLDLNPGKSPGIDSLTAEFYKCFWNLIGHDFYAVLLECVDKEILPLSCRRAIFTLIPKKGDLGLLKNWHPVSLLTVDLKILSKALTNRLKQCISSVIHEDQTYCIPIKK